MSTLSLTTAIATYGHTTPLKEGTVPAERIALEHLDVSPITSAFRRMVRSLAYDVAEMAFSTYLCARAYDKPITALPIFLLRRFEHGSIVYNVKSGIQTPADLHGRRVGLRSYTLTPGVWVRGILQDVYGVDHRQVQWVLSGDEHVAEYVPPANVTTAPAGSDLADMLLAGEIDAAIGVRGINAPEIQPLIPDARHAAAQYYQQAGVYPISHLVVLKDELLRAHPWLAPELFRLFNTAKEAYLTHLRRGTSLTPQDQAMQAMQQVLGEDPLLYGVARNEQTMTTFIKFNVAQQIIPQAVDIEALFPRNVLALA
ncbi:MAG: ABC transporter substrate-binding protein [Candidatus Tectomicrobia bacterium]|uniref:ABC transporter substrate-binding protein n=1 Tax=Tectimicrobiota bacterium TaxID=2528274 RepID=A0A937W2L3_UNCTE|nr:ABC transporter substrate-binding protein [Candidatus Tectomicrobia bacterium]